MHCRREGKSKLWTMNTQGKFRTYILQYLPVSFCLLFYQSSELLDPAFPKHRDLTSLENARWDGLSVAVGQYTVERSLTTMPTKRSPTPGCTVLAFSPVRTPVSSRPVPSVIKWMPDRPTGYPAGGSTRFLWRTSVRWCCHHCPILQRRYSTLVKSSLVVTFTFHLSKFQPTSSANTPRLAYGFCHGQVKQ